MPEGTDLCAGRLLSIAWLKNHLIYYMTLEQRRPSIVSSQMNIKL